jgi:tetratricopeptide (TPR) repeat protein
MRLVLLTIAKLIVCLAVVVASSSLAGAGSSVRKENEMAQRVSAELKAALSLYEMPWQEINALILQERFAEFEAISKQYEEKFKTDPKYESPLTKLYTSLNVENDLLLKKLDIWVAQRPSHMSHGARGIHKKYRGYRARGGEFAKDTPAAQFERMAKLHREAITDLLAAIKENSRFAPAYVALIDIVRGSGDSTSAERTLAEAVRWIPETYYVRHAYLRALHPRWGGDYSLMQAYTNSLDEAARLNPRIWSLKAEVPAELGYDAWLSRDYPQAIKYYTEALSFGDRLEFLNNRGRIFMSTKQYAAAKSDFTRYLEYSPSDAEVTRLLRSLDGVK